MTTKLKHETADTSLMALFHCMVRFGTAHYGTVRLSLCFHCSLSTAIEWAGLFTRRYSCAVSTAVT